jgi:hypothetical protein
MPPCFRERDPDLASRLELQLLRLQLDARCNCSHTIPRALTFDMRGARKAQPFGHPLDGRVRPRGLTGQAQALLRQARIRQVCLPQQRATTVCCTVQR